MNDGIDVAYQRGSFTIRKADGVKKPPAQHSNMRQAEEAAALLAARQPEATFIISQEVARVTASATNVRRSDANRCTPRTSKSQRQVDQFRLKNSEDPNGGTLGLAGNTVPSGDRVCDRLLDQDGEWLGRVHGEIAKLGRAATTPRDVGVGDAHAAQGYAPRVSTQAAKADGGRL